MDHLSRTAQVLKDSESGLREQLAELTKVCMCHVFDHDRVYVFHPLLEVWMLLRVVSAMQYTSAVEHELTLRRC